nr:hypothetical protein CFP56_19513 [Quercus suber]
MLFEVDAERHVASAVSAALRVRHDAVGFGSRSLSAVGLQHHGVLWNRSSGRGIDSSYCTEVVPVAHDPVAAEGRRRLVNLSERGASLDYTAFEVLSFTEDIMLDVGHATVKPFVADWEKLTGSVAGNEVPRLDLNARCTSTSTTVSPSLTYLSISKSNLYAEGNPDEDLRYGHNVKYSHTTPRGHMLEWPEGLRGNPALSPSLRSQPLGRSTVRHLACIRRAVCYSTPSDGSRASEVIPRSSTRWSRQCQKPRGQQISTSAHSIRGTVDVLESMKVMTWRRDGRATAKPSQLSLRFWSYVVSWIDIRSIDRNDTKDDTS